jgi:signal transduction histidine kinase
MERTARAAAHTAVAVAVAGALVAVLLAARGPVDALAWLVTATGLLYLPVVLVGSTLVRAERRSPVGWIFLVSGAAVPLSAATGAAVQVAAARGGADPGLLQLIASQFLVLGIFPMAGFGLLLFPDGRLDSRRRRLLAVACGVHLLVVWVWATFGTENFSAVPGVRNPVGVTGSAGGLVEAGILGILLTGPIAALTSWALLRRARRADGRARRGLVLAAVAGFVVAAAFLCCVVVGVSGGDTEQVSVLENLAVLAVGVTAWAGIVRYGLYDVRVVLSRSITYGVLLVAVLGVYAAAAAGLRALLGEVTSAALATALAVVVALPLREWLGRRVRVRVYGLVDEPGTALARLGERLTAVGAPGDVLPAAVRTVAEVLRLPYVAVEVDGRVLATAGHPWPGDTERVALPYGGETVGVLVLQRADDRGRPRDRALLDTLVQQVAVAARAVALAEDLQRSRVQLVALREDERRRLRRELHDGLGPTMAGIALGIDTIARDPATTETGRAALKELRTETEQAVGEVRRIVYGLRPPVLDELGLAEAIREQAARLGVPAIRIDAALPALPAAVEVAAYRIVVEAVANAVRHAVGGAVSVCLRVEDGEVRIEVVDDGPGLPDGFVAGVGISSMRERAAELGGSCTVERRERGTSVTALLPVPA